MSHKRKAGKPIMMNAPSGVPQELREVADTLELGQHRGRENFDLAIECLKQRFISSKYFTSGKTADQLVFESIHTLIGFLNDVYPISESGRPLGVPEAAVLFGAVLGTAAAPAYIQGEAKMPEIEGQLEIVWISMREWLMRGYLMIKALQAKGITGDSRLIVPPGVH